MTLLISDSDVRDLWDPAALVDAVERGLVAEEAVGGPVQPGRMTLGGSDMFLRVMPAMLTASGVFGLKTFFGSVERGVRYVVLLASMADGEVLALVDAAFLTAARTGATSGAATRHLARSDAASIGVIGSGLEAETNLLCVHAVRPAKEVRVYSPNAGRREGFAERMGTRLGIDVVPCDTPQAAVEDADTVVVATNTGKGGDVAFRGAWLAAGQHVVSIGSTAPWLREIDTDTFLAADDVIFDVSLAQMADESGDVMAFLTDRPGWDGGRLLGAILARTAPIERGADDITLFKSVGAASQDLIAAHTVYEAALRSGRGCAVDDVAVPKLFA